MCRSSSTFDRLPNDILREIFSWLPIKDIIRIRQVCCALCLFSRERIVWLDALRGESIRNQVTLRSYPAYSDAVSWQLERYTTAPYKFIARVSGGEVQAHRERILRPKPSRGNIDNLLVIPGGRYIVTSSPSGWVVAWDLCGPENGTTRPTTLAEMLFPGPVCSLELASVTEHEVNVLVVRYAYTNPFQRSLQVMKFALNDTNHQPKVSKALEVVEKVRQVDVNSDGVIMVAFTQRIILFRTDSEEYAEINLRRMSSYAVAELHIAFLHGSDIIVVQRRGEGMYFLVYTMPAFHPNHAAARSIPGYPPRIVHQLALDHQDDFIYLSIPAVVHPFGSQSMGALRLSVICRLSSRTCTPYIIVDDRPGLSSTPSTPLPVALSQISRDITGGIFGAAFNRPCLVDDILVAMHRDGQSLTCHTARLSLSSAPNLTAFEETDTLAACGRSLVGQIPQHEKVLAINPWRGEVYTSMPYGACEVRAFEYFIQNAS